jgi:hypothetical protein
MRALVVIVLTDIDDAQRISISVSISVADKKVKLSPCLTN